MRYLFQPLKCSILLNKPESNSFKMKWLLLWNTLITVMILVCSEMKVYFEKDFKSKNDKEIE